MKHALENYKLKRPVTSKAKTAERELEERMTAFYKKNMFWVVGKMKERGYSFSSVQRAFDIAEKTRDTSIQHLLANIKNTWTEKKL